MSIPHQYYGAVEKGRYEPYIDQESGLRFDFRYEPTRPFLLHISVRHGVGPQQAIDTFFEGRLPGTRSTSGSRPSAIPMDFTGPGACRMRWYWSLAASEGMSEMGRRAIERGEPYEMDPEEDARATAMIDQAERDIEEMRASGRWGPSEDSIPIEGPAAKARVPEEAKVTMRWPREQLDVVRKAAELFGMPYQTYVKQAAFRAALDDLQKLEAATGTAKKREAA